MLSELNSLRGSDLSRGPAQYRSAEESGIAGAPREASLIQDFLGKQACGRQRAGGSPRSHSVHLILFPTCVNCGISGQC